MFFVILDVLLVILFVICAAMASQLDSENGYVPLYLGRAFFWAFVTVLLLLIIGVLLTPFGGFIRGVQAITSILIVLGILGLFLISGLIAHRRNPDPGKKRPWWRR